MHHPLIYNITQPMIPILTTVTALFTNLDIIIDRSTAIHQSGRTVTLSHISVQHAYPKALRKKEEILFSFTRMEVFGHFCKSVGRR